MAVLGSGLTTIRVGGVIDRFDQPASEEALIALLQERGTRRKAIGGGSNLVLADSGFRGTLVRSEFNEISQCEHSLYTDEVDQWCQTRPEEGRYSGSDLYLSNPSSGQEYALLSVGSNVQWARLVAYCLSHQLLGLGTYARIPCRVGGAVVNNIHAGTELLGRHVAAVHTVDQHGTLRSYHQGTLAFGYDSSRFIAQPEFIVRVIFILQKVSAEESKAEAEAYRNILQRKSQSQPAGPNCGSVFQNVPAVGGNPSAAAWYIEQSGCKGVRFGNMEVSPVHANFIVNLGNGTQSDFLELANVVMDRVWKQFSIRLTPEVEVIDEWGVSRWG